MDKEVFDYVKERAEILATTGSSKQITKDAANAWLSAVEADSSDAAVEAATDTLLAYLDGRPHSIDDAIGFAAGPAKEAFGEETAAQMLAGAKAAKEAGKKFCTCEACTAASEILGKFGKVEL